MTERRYVELQTKPIDPNKAKWYALALAAAAALFAIMTVRSNFDYFETYYTGWAFWMRVVPFCAFEATIVLLTLTKGWGNPRQMWAALVFEVLMIAIGLTHTYYVSGATQTRISAERSKAAAKVDFSATQEAATRAGEANARLQTEYNKALNVWRRAAADARFLRQPIPPAPEPPRYLEVPQVSQSMVSTAALDVEGKVESEVPHRSLLRLLYLMIALTIGAWTSVVFLADSSRLRYWLLQQLGAELDDKINGGRIKTLSEAPPRRFQPGLAPPTNAEAKARPQD